MALHVNPIGLIRLGTTNVDRFEKFNTLLNEAGERGANIAIPTFSYSFVGDAEVFDIKETPSALDALSEYLRIQNQHKRTADANFSYLIFGANISQTHFEVRDVSTFGPGGLIEEIYIKDGFLCAVGGVLEHLTEVHFIERKLGVDYRFDTEFQGQVVDAKGNTSRQTTTYYCRNLNSEYIASFLQLKHDLRRLNLIDNWFVDGYRMKFEVIRFAEAYEFIKDQVRANPKYLWGRK